MAKFKEALEHLLSSQAAPGKARDALKKESKHIAKKPETIDYNAGPVKKAALILLTASHNQGISIRDFQLSHYGNKIKVSPQEIRDFRDATGTKAPTPRQIVRKQGSRLELPNETIKLAGDMLHEDQKRNPSTRKDDVTQAASALMAACEAHKIRKSAAQISRQTSVTSESIYTNRDRMKKLAKYEHHFK